MSIIAPRSESLERMVTGVVTGYAKLCVALSEVAPNEPDDPWTLFQVPVSTHCSPAVAVLWGRLARVEFGSDVVSRFLLLLSTAVCVLLAMPDAGAQGQDSTAAERDIQVIDAMLAGLYSNANQSYFDRRLGRATRHAGWEVRITRSEAGSANFELSASALADGAAGPRFSLRLGLDEAKTTVVLRAGLRPPQPPPGAIADEPPPACELEWRRSAAEFVATQRGRCHSGAIRRLVLSADQLWIEVDGMAGGDLELHRAREFLCYADIPGVGGGRDEPYDRYEGLALHDQGGSAWFTSKEGRRLGVSMLLVDWPMNNYKGAFARDSLVVYVSEEADEGRQELGYAFTVPEADRIGINLKWMLVNCFMQSNADTTPYM